MFRYARLLVPVLVLLAFPASALGGATKPKISVSLAEGFFVDGARSVRMEGVFDLEDAVQTAYSLHIIVYQGTQFARFPVSEAPVAGTSAALADGNLDEAEVPAFLLDGAAAPPGVRLARYTLDRALVTLPVQFAAGPATVLIMADLLPDRVVFSNPLVFTLP